MSISKAQAFRDGFEAAIRAAQSYVKSSGSGFGPGSAVLINIAKGLGDLKPPPYEDDSLAPRFFDKTLLDGVTHWLRMANKERVVELCVRTVTDSLVGYMAEDKAWVSVSPTTRRAELYSVLKVAAQQMDLLAEHVGNEAKKHI